MEEETTVNRMRSNTSYSRNECYLFIQKLSGMEAGLSVRVQKVLNRLRTSVVELCKSLVYGVYRGLIEQNEEYNGAL